MAVRRSGLLALLIVPVVATSVFGGSIVKLALPIEDPEPQPQRPVGEPDAPPSIGLDFFEADLGSQDSPRGSLAVAKQPRR